MEIARLLYARHETHQYDQLNNDFSVPPSR
jgi:hypothetical protein